MGWFRNFLAWLRDDDVPAPALASSPSPVTAEGRRLTIGVGVNEYLGSPENALRGCVNDSVNVRHELEQRGWEAPAELLFDHEATKRRTLEVIGNTCASLRTGDTLLVQWSSHGTRIHDPAEADGLLEAICPTDAMADWPRNLVTVLDLARILREQVAPGALVLLLVDACHSGVRGADAGNYARALNPLYRRARVLLGPVAAGGTRVRGLSGAVTGQVATPWSRTVLLSGCRSDQVSLDTCIAGEYQGAMTWAFLRALRWTRSERTLRELHVHMRQILTAQGYAQEPQLLGSPPQLERRVFG